MAFLNPAPGAFARRWARLTASEADALERRLRDSVRGGDDFVEVPLPRLASMNRRVAAEAVQSYKKQREIVDARLQRNVALAAKGQSFADLCAQLSKETGVQIEAARSVADDKVTVFCKARPAREVMRAVTELFDFYWERFGEEGNYRYRLIQPLRSQLLEEELRNRDRNEALLALDRQMEKVKALLDLSPGDAQERLKSATTDEEKKLLGLLAGPQAGSARLYFGLGQEELGALRAGQELKFSTDPALAALTLPAELRYPTLKGVEQKETAFLEPTTGTNFKMHRRMGEEKAPTPPTGSVPLSQWPSAIPFVALKLDASNLGQVRLMGSGGYRVEGKSVGPDGKEDVNSFTSIYGQPLAVGASPSAEDPKNAEANASLTSDPALGEPVKLPAAPAGALATKPAGQKWITSADIAEAFHRATGRDVVADHYTRLFEPSLLGTGDAAGGKLFDVLSRVSDKARLRWGYADAWLSFRSASFFNDRPKEIPNRLLDRWVAARKANDDRLPFDVMLEAVQLSDAQLDGEEMARGVRELYGIAEWDTLRATNMRQGWRFLAALPKNLRAAALSEKGLAFEQLPLGQQQQFGTLTFGSDTPGVTVGDLAGATLRVELPGGPDEKDKDQPWVRMTYLYGGERTGRTKKVQTPGSSSVSNDGPDAAKNLKPDAPLKG